MKGHLCKVAAVALLMSSNLGAESAADSEPEAAVLSGGEGFEGAEATTATVTRSEKGVEILSPDGRRVLLKKDHTWEYIEVDSLPPEQSAVLEVVNLMKLRNACDIGFRLTNNLPYEVKSLVPTFSAFTRDDILFEGRSKSFNSIKPTDSQYKKIRFIGITCPDIAYVVVSGGDRCTMGPFTKFDMAEGECLKRVYIQASNLIKVLK
jgi:hypothetical protein